MAPSSPLRESSLTAELKRPMPTGEMLLAGGFTKNDVMGYGIEVMRLDGRSSCIALALHFPSAGSLRGW
jgi:hypothetical protein